MWGCGPWRPSSTSRTAAQGLKNCGLCFSLKKGLAFDNMVAWFGGIMVACCIYDHKVMGSTRSWFTIKWLLLRWVTVGEQVNCPGAKFTKHLRTFLWQFYDILHTHANVLIHKTSYDNFTTKVLRSLFRCLWHLIYIIPTSDKKTSLYRTFNSIILVI